MQTETFSILIFHGSSMSEANVAAHKFAEQLAANSDCRNFTICFLKGVAPELATAINSAIAAGWQHLRLIPLFLLPGTHTTFDIPKAATCARTRFPEVKIEILDCLVNMQGFLNLVANQIKENPE